VAGKNSGLSDFFQIDLTLFFCPGVSILAGVDFNQVSPGFLAGLNLVLQGINENADSYSGLFSSWM